MLSLLHIARPAGHPEIDEHEYRDPLPTDARAPCPFLNTLANHGYIRRDGRYVTLWAATRGMMECYNYTLTLALFVAAAGIYTSLFTNLNPFWFDLDLLKVHNKISIEHDASLSRDNIASGDNHDPDPKLIQQMLKTSVAPDGSLNIDDYARYRVEREAVAIPKPFADVSFLRDLLATGEIGLYLPAVGRNEKQGSTDVLERKVSPAWIESFFGHARLPPDWVPSPVPVAISDVTAVRKAMQTKMKAIREGKKTD